MALLRSVLRDYGGQAEKMKYDFKRIEKYWQSKWLKEGVYEPSFAQGDHSALRRAHGKKAAPFYNLMMFPYPSAEGLHVGNMYAFVGSDIYGRVKRMQGNDVFEPIGLDGFGIHSENYALKTKKHPAEQAKISEKNFYRQLREIGNGFAWNEHLETFDPKYYKWTQWIFTQMFKNGLAYRRKQAVNWCPSCLTVLADEQVVGGPARLSDVSRSGGKCERCDSVVEKKELEQWFFRITKYAERLIKDLDGLDWSERIKVAQRNWIGKSEGTEIDFPVVLNKNTNFLILHGYTGHVNKNFIPWLKEKLEQQGFGVQAPQMPNTDHPVESEQVDYVVKNCRINEHTIIVGHSLGGVVAMKVLQKINRPIAGLVLVAPAVEPRFRTGEERPFWKTFSFEYDYELLKKLSNSVTIISDSLEKDKRGPYLEYLRDKLQTKFIEGFAHKEHLTGAQEPLILNTLLPTIKVFTTRPDTLYGATYVVLAPEHPLISNLSAKGGSASGGKSQILNLREVEAYVRRAKKKSENERIAEGRKKTGVELKGVEAMNPGTKREIPIWVADYVVMGYGTGAIMAVPAHDERDAEFAEMFGLPASDAPLVDSDKVMRDVGGVKKVQYRLRDWLISRQRYWGPPIPMIYCGACAKEKRGERDDMPGWHAVPENDLPVELPKVKNFRPKGMGKSPLATVRSFYEVKCPHCGAKGVRETDVSDTFLDSAWYYLRYLDPKDKNSPFDKLRIKKWLPVHMYIGGAEHAVLHLLYVRFMWKALCDLGILPFSAKGGSASGGDEPAKKFRAHGLLIREGKKISKSRGNIVNPDEFIKKFGADALRMHLMFIGPFEEGGDFRDAGILGPVRFLERVWKLEHNANLQMNSNATNKKIERLVHKTIKKITEDIENLHYNTAISSLMILLSELEKGTDKKSYSDFLKLLAPFAPHITEEIWRNVLGNKNSIHISPWPSYDERLIQDEKFMLVIQVNGKVRDSVEVNVDISESDAKETALRREKITAFLAGKKPKRVIYVPQRLINIVV